MYLITAESAEFEGETAEELVPPKALWLLEFSVGR
jgi:hypothetical protein